MEPRSVANVTTVEPSSRTKAIEEAAKHYRRASEVANSAWKTERAAREARMEAELAADEAKRALDKAVGALVEVAA